VSAFAVAMHASLTISMLRPAMLPDLSTMRSSATLGARTRWTLASSGSGGVGGGGVGGVGGASCGGFLAIGPTASANETGSSFSRSLRA
jgi:uncharacterized membrane protein